MHKEEHERELTELEAALRRLRPVAAGVDRDELMFNAGRATAGRRAGVYASATVMVAALAAFIGAGTAWWASRSWPRAVVQVTVEKPVLRIVELSPLLPSAREAEAWTGGGDYLKLRDRVLAEGVGALPTLQSGGASAGASLEDLYRELGIQNLRLHVPGRWSSNERSSRT
jgi:hypothetical protein